MKTQTVRGSKASVPVDIWESLWWPSLLQEEEAETSSDHLTLPMMPPSTTTMAETIQQGKNSGVKAAQKLLINPFNSAHICIFFSKFVKQFAAFKSGIFLCFIHQELSTPLPHLEIDQLSTDAQDDENKRIKYIFSSSFLLFFLRLQVRTWIPTQPLGFSRTKKSLCWVLSNKSHVPSNSAPTETLLSFGGGSQIFST